MEIKLIAIDIDGTLLNSHHQVTIEVKKALKEAQNQGVKIVLCTGRPMTGVTTLLKELELTSQNDYVITYNGSLVQNCKTGEKISSHGLSYENYLEIEMMARKLNCPLHTETEDTMYTSNRDISPYTIHEASLVNMPLKFRTPEEMTSELNIIKMMMIDEPNKLAIVEKKIPQSMYEKFTIVKSTPFFLEILNKHVDKGIGVHNLATYLGIQPEEVMAIGDNENDFEMIKYAGFGVAMGNATENIKNHAQFITKTNNENGVAYAINLHVLSK